MAAPTLSPHQGNNAKKKQGKAKKKDQDSVKKVSKKNILLPPFQLEWPKVNEDVEDRILSALILKLKEFPRLEEKKRGGVGSRDRADTDDDLVRKRLREQLTLGHRQVCKGLERDQLSLVLVWRAAQPPLLIRSLLPLAASRDCPALCLNKLVPTVTDTTGLSSLVTLGFKKIQPGLDDFADFIAMATPLAPPLSVPWLPQKKTSTADAENVTETKEEADTEVHSDEEASATDTADDHSNSAREEKGTVDPHIDWPVMSADQEKQLLEKLIGLLIPYKSVFKKPKPRFTTKEWKSQRKTIRSHLLTDLAAIGDAAKSGRLGLLLVQNDVNLPRPALTSLVTVAVQKGCPVLRLDSLRKELNGVVRNPLLQAVGFRTQKDSKEFTDFIKFAEQFLPSKAPKPVVEKQAAKEAGQKSSRPKKPPIPHYDVSHLYVYKSDTKKTAAEDAVTESSASDQDGKKRKITLSSETEDYISLSSKPTVQFLGLKPQTSDPTQSSESASFFLDTKGSGVSVKQLTPNRTDMEKKENSPTEERGATSLLGVMCLDSVDPKPVPAPLYHEPVKPKTKANLKRKLASSAESGDFLSFKLAPTNVQTTVCNPNKKKKKKKKR